MLGRVWNSGIVSCPEGVESAESEIGHRFQPATQSGCLLGSKVHMLEEILGFTCQEALDCPGRVPSLLSTPMRALM